MPREPGVPDGASAAGIPATLADKVAALADPASYPGRPARIESIETHFAWVFLTGQYAYKLKKPLSLKGADLRTVDARERMCREELRLNRRLAARTYLRVAPLAADDGRLTIDGSGPVQDWLVVMRELPREHMLDRRLAAGAIDSRDIDRIIGTLVRFYRSVPPEALSPEAYCEAVQGRVAEAVRELGRREFGLPPDEIGDLRQELESACTRLAPLLAERAASGRVVEAHGDLRAEHVWLGPQVQIIDALEFDRRLRVLDAAEEVAMLAVDVIRLGFPAPAGALLQSYQRTMPDSLPTGLSAFYQSLRAATRAKVAIWHLDDDGQFPDPAPWRRRAMDFVRLARAALRNHGRRTREPS
jgi:aminoglycoside phosphotransferase family enzyme